MMKTMEHKKGIVLVALKPGSFPAGGAEKVSAAGEGREVVVASEQDEIAQYLDRIEIAAGDFPFSLISRAPNLRWVQLWSAGADWLQKYPEVKDLPFLLTTTSGMHGPQMAEHLFALLLAWCRALPKAFAAQRQHQWLKLGGGSLSLLDGKSMLILGYGSIGESAARAAAGFGMSVTGLRRNPPAGKADGTVRIVPSARLHDELPRADFVVNILPHTPETRGSFGKKEFELMKNSAVYCNIGRGATTDETALAEALERETIAGALLDVFGTEPLDPGSPLWDMENVIITGHYGGIRPDYGEKALEIFLDNLGRYTRGESLMNLVDKRQGY
ncbi:D-2-hydroxyacid dehydrogenase [Breznakiella homolactica]|uniref:D-2-hydroxyacid dehydrogenase n=1 Tax=Breznakiella homolactica TaxID=2798577 RepID=A0A7T7XNC7_9SPIR|nr:D-2-hydroxyacid dehydrogenase [Breznakiella homolactica]QQO09418.1 D-2-hydroxyacid dehydrogenase [Breznakiella homolactica]